MNETERATMRARLVGLALASTLLVLSPAADRTTAGLALLLYALAIALLRVLAPRIRHVAVPIAGISADLLFAGALVLVLPLSHPSWPVFAVAVATSALRFGPAGAAAATAAAIVSYDISLAVRVGEATALDLVPLQALLAIGLISAELTWSAVRGEAERRVLRAHAETQSALAATVTTERDQLAKRVDELEVLATDLRREVRERDEAVASAVHELRTPLTSVQGYGQLMGRNLEAVQRQVAQLDRLIGDLLRLADDPITIAPTGPVDLLKETREAVNRLRLVTDSEVRVETDGTDFSVHGDAGRLAQVLDNLLRNAAKFSPAGAAITVGLRREPEHVTISVADRGSGIPADELIRIFERYYRGTGHRAIPGEGIGLAVSREIVLAHGGRIWATSDGPGRGSTFFATIPVAGKALSKPSAEPTPLTRRAG